MEQDKSIKKYVIDLGNPPPRKTPPREIAPEKEFKRIRIPELANLTEEEKEDIRKRVHEALNR
jgi:hypothetical protein